MILDSTFLIDVLRAERTVGDLVEDVEQSGPPFVTTVTVMELHEGIHLADSSEREHEAVSELLEGLNELPFGRKSAIRAGQINAELVEAGEPIDETDVMIAATALVNDVPVVTRNVDHFDRIEPLEVISY